MSILSIDVKKEADCDPARVHCLYGMSKDFGANGLRIGVLVSQHNPALMRAVLSTAILMKISSASASASLAQSSNLDVTPVGRTVVELTERREDAYLLCRGEPKAPH